MSQPAWLKKTRPCPFFSQGRCLFADSCNFLHDVKVRNVAQQPLLVARLVKHPSPSPQPVPDPPSVVVNAASPRSVDLPSPQSSGSSPQDSSRYSGLLSVLSDVIGPPSTTPVSEAVSVISPGPGEMETGQYASTTCGEPSSIFEPETTLVDPCSEYIPEANPAMFFPVSSEEVPASDGTGTYVIGSEVEHQDDTDDCEEEDLSVNRQSTFSSFTGASLLASPRQNIFGEPSGVSPAGSGAAELLSPVQMSAKLRPFSVPSLGSVARRDSGYADGENWTSPVPFPRSPPRSSRSSAMFPPHVRRAAASSPTCEDKKDVGALRPSCSNPIEVIKESEFEGRLEDDEATALSVIGVYGAFLAEGLGEGEVCDPLQVNVTEEKAEGDGKPSWVPWSRQCSSEHLHPAADHDLDPCNQSSFISDDSVSFKTALSTQPSYENLSDTFRVSPIKQDSLLSYLSGSSTPETSVLSHFGDTNESLEQSTSAKQAYDIFYPADQNDDPVAESSEEHRLLEDATVDSNLPPTPVGAGDQGLAPEKIISPRGTFHPDSARSLSSANDDIPFSYEEGVTQGCSRGALMGVYLSSPRESLIADGPSRQSLTEDSHEYVAVDVDQRLGVGDSNEVSNLDLHGDSLTQRLSFPLPPFRPVGNPTSRDEDASHLLQPPITNLVDDMSNARTGLLDVDIGWVHSASDLTEKARPSELPLVESDSYADLISRRSRAASDITVKGMPPPTSPVADTPRISRSPPPSLEQPCPPNSVLPLYDQYFKGDVSSYPLELSNPRPKGTTPPELPSLLADAEKHPGSGADSSRSEYVLRPFLTGRRSLLRSSLTELVPKPNANGSSFHTISSIRLQAREAGSTMVPLGFKRYRPRPAALQSFQPSCTTLSVSELRSVLRIRTDIAREDIPLECFSAGDAPSFTWVPLPTKAMSAPPSSGLRQLRLSSIINKRSSILSTQSSSITSSTSSLDHSSNSAIPRSPSVSSTTSFSHSPSLSSSCAQIPDQIHHTFQRFRSSSPVLQGNHNAHSESQSHPATHIVSVSTQPPKSWRLSHYRAGSRHYTSIDGTHRFMRSASTLSLSYTANEEQGVNEADSTMSQSNHAEDWTRPASVLAAPIHAIATPKPDLLFAIASDDVDQVRQVLESGEAGPNDSVGPQSALAFTLTNNKLTHKQEIVKALLAYGANPSALKNPTLNPAPRLEGSDEQSGPPPETTLEGMDPATRYFVARADAAHAPETSRLIYRSFFRPLTRVRYDVIGQDWALEQLFRVLSMHSQKLAVAPIVVLLCGPSGHGKSLLARKFGSLLDVPTHTVNMTTLQSAHDIWQSYSMSPYEEPSSCTLAEFLIDNEGKRCVVVLDEIEKVEDQKALFSLLIPWELGRCSLEAGKRHVDTRNVTWIGTSNIGHQLVFEHHQNRRKPDERMSREEYLELTALLRPLVSHCLGPSLVSRVTTVLPFVPFTLDERKAITAEAVYTLARDAFRTLSHQDVESLVTRALPNYQPAEGARSLHRAISNILVDMI